MALSANTVFEVRNGGSDTNGGGWVTGSSASGGTDWSQQTTAQYSVTDAVTAGSTIITSATAAFGTDVVGNIAYVQGGGGAVSSGWYQVISRTNATTIVVDRATGLTAGTSTTLKIGGAFASPGAAANVATVSGMITFIKYSSTPFTISSTTNNVPGGCISGVDGTLYAGYDTTRSTYNLDANRPTIKLSSATGSATTIITNLNAVYYVQTMILDGSSVAGSICGRHSGEYFYVKAVGGVSGGLRQNATTGRGILCEVTGCSAAAMDLNISEYCYVHDNTYASPANTGAILSMNSVNCISLGNNTAGFFPGGNSINCVAYNNGQSGFDAVNNNGISFINCISESNSSLGFRANTGSYSLINCATFGNGSGRSVVPAGKITLDINPITGTGSFFTSSTNFTLNNTAGAGAAARAAAFPSSWPVPSMSDYADVGALQSSNTGGGTTTTIYGVIGS